PERADRRDLRTHGARMSEQGESEPTVLDTLEEQERPPVSAPRALPAVLPIVPLKNTVVFPHIPTPLAVGRPASIKLIDDVMVKDRLVGLVLQKDSSLDDPKENDLHAVGTAAVIQRLLKFPDGTVRILVGGFERIRVTRVARTDPYLAADVSLLSEQVEESVEIEALVKNLQNLVRRMLSLMPIASEEVGVALLNVESPARLADLAAVLLVRDAAAKQEYLETLSVHERLLKLTRHLSREIEVLELGSKIQKEVQDEMEKGQREFVLRQQLKAIQKELGADNDNEVTIEKLQEEIEKDRILEFLAVRKLKAESRGPILCFVGPPGAGKTSLGKSIARAMGRAFYRLSLGGIRDEAEIRGHRRTYVGALPGQIVQGLR